MIYSHEHKAKPKGPVEPYPIESPTLVVVMKEYLTGRAMSYPCARFNGWYPSKLIDGIPRIIIPATNLEGRRYWQARAMNNTLARDRWRSAKGTKGTSIVVCWPLAWEGTHKLVVCEGPLDALAAATTKHIGLAAMGKINVKDVVEYIMSGIRLQRVFADQKVLIVPDVDSPEFGAKAITQLALAGIKAEIRMPEFEDLAALSPKKRERLLA